MYLHTIILSSLLFSFIFTEMNECSLQNLTNINTRSIYDVGDTLTMEDQYFSYPICNGDSNFNTSESFSFSDLNGDLNGGDYKITLISMNATW